jgi:hypothetical protein
MRRKSRHPSLKIDENCRNPVNSSLRKELLRSNVMIKKPSNLNISKPKGRKKKFRNRDDMKGQPSLTSIKRKTNKENSRNKANHTELSIDYDRTNNWKKRSTFTDKFNLMKKQKLMFINNFNKNDKEDKLKKTNYRSSSNKMNKLKKMFKEQRRNTCNDQYANFINHTRSRAKKSFYNDNGNLFNFISEKSELRKTINNLSVVNESSLNNNTICQSPSKKNNEIKLSMINTIKYPKENTNKISVEKNQKQRKFLKRKSFYKKDIFRKTRIAIDKESFKYKELTGISFFNMNHNSRGWEQIKAIRKTQYKKSINDVKSLNKICQKTLINGRETNMFPKIQHESNYSFTKSVYNK